MVEEFPGKSMKTLVFFIALIFHVSSYAYGEVEHGKMANYNIQNAYIKATPPGVRTTAAYFKLTNHSAKPLTVVDAQSDVARITEIHQHKMVDGLMTMQKVDSIVVEAGQSVEFKPGGYHIMLINLNKPVTDDEVVNFVLLMADGDAIRVAAEVVARKE